MDVKDQDSTSEFVELSDRCRGRKTNDLNDKASAEQPAYSAQTSRRAEDNEENTLSPTRATDYQKVMLSTDQCVINATFKALNLFVEAEFSREQWEGLHSFRDLRNLYPSYSTIKKEMKNCYPNQQSMTVTDTCAQVKLQDLLDHTSLRLCKYLESVLENISDEEKVNLQLIAKWGCDGSNQSEYRQQFENYIDSITNIFVSSFVPLRLQSVTKEHIKILWQNPLPYSTKFCRPIRIRFIQDTEDVTNEEMNNIEKQASNLHKTEIHTPKGTINITYDLLPIMVDAKICNATNTSSTIKCYICGLTSNNLNDLTKRNEVDPDSLNFGLSILHITIRFFESLLHLSYKLTVKKWHISTDEDIKTVKERKENIQKALNEEMKLWVDIPKSEANDGYTNDGSTSLVFFSDPETVSRITGIDRTLIHKFKVILETISSGHAIDMKKIEDYAFETAALYVELYEWHPMSFTLHNILIHGATVITHCILPIGQLYHDAVEVRNKHREDYNRIFNNLECNKDILQRLLLTSDPLLSGNRKQRIKKRKSFSPEALSLLLPETEKEQLETSDDEDDDDSDWDD